MIILVITKAQGEVEARAEKEFTVALEAKEYIRTSPEGSVFKVSIKQDETAEPNVTEFVSAEAARDAIDAAVGGTEAPATPATDTPQADVPPQA